MPFQIIIVDKYIKDEMRMIKNIKNEVIISLLIMYILGFYINYEVYFLLTFGFVLFSVGIRIEKPKIQGLAPYFLMVIFASVIGLFSFSMRNVSRDIFYIVPTLIWILYGYNICSKKGVRPILKTIYLATALTSIISFMLFIISFDYSFNNFRVVFSKGVYDAGFVLPIFAYETLLKKRRIFGKAIDKIFIVCILLQVAFSFGRIVYVEILLSWSIICVFALIFEQNKSDTFRRWLWISIMLIIGFLFFWNIFPDTIINEFIVKINKTFSEIDKVNTINTLASAQENWRAYEMLSAIDTWNYGGVLSKIFGGGMGKGVAISYIPYSMINNAIDGKIPLLHNGFYTILVKAGLLGVLCLIWLFFGNIVHGIKMLNRSTPEAISLIAISVAAIANTYVWRGPIAQSPLLGWALLVSIFNYSLEKWNSTKKVDI